VIKLTILTCADFQIFVPIFLMLATDGETSVTLHLKPFL